MPKSDTSTKLEGTPPGQYEYMLARDALSRIEVALSAGGPAAAKRRDLDILSLMVNRLSHYQRFRGVREQPEFQTLAARCATLKFQHYVWVRRRLALHSLHRQSGLDETSHLVLYGRWAKGTVMYLERLSFEPLVMVAHHVLEGQRPHLLSYPDAGGAPQAWQYLPWQTRRVRLREIRQALSHVRGDTEVKDYL